MDETDGTVLGTAGWEEDYEDNSDGRWHPRGGVPVAKRMRNLSDIGRESDRGRGRATNSIRGGRGSTRGTRSRGSRGRGGAARPPLRPVPALRPAPVIARSDVGDSRPWVREWKQMVDGFMMVSLEYKGRQYKGPLTLQPREEVRFVPLLPRPCFAPGIFSDC